MNTPISTNTRPGGSFRFRPIVAGLAVLALTASPAWAAQNEDSLICAKIKDDYNAQAYEAAFWLRSAEYGDMNWCDMKVKAVEHCVPVESVMQTTNAPYEGFRGDTLNTEYTCYRIRCANAEGNTFMGNSVVLDDTFGARTAGKPHVTRVCLPDR